MPSWSLKPSEVDRLKRGINGKLGLCCDRQNHKTVKAQKKDWPVLIRVDSKVILQNVRQLKDVFQHCLNPVPYFKN